MLGLELGWSAFFSGRPITLHADDVTPIRDDSNRADVPVSLIRNRKSTINSWMAMKFNVTGARQRSCFQKQPHEGRG